MSGFFDMRAIQQNELVQQGTEIGRAIVGDLEDAGFPVCVASAFSDNRYNIVLGDIEEAAFIRCDIEHNKVYTRIDSHIFGVEFTNENPFSITLDLASPNSLSKLKSWIKKALNAIDHLNKLRSASDNVQQSVVTSRRSSEA